MFDQLEALSDSSTTRRSAGLPSIIQTVLISEARCGQVATFVLILFCCLFAICVYDIICCHYLMFSVQINIYKCTVLYHINITITKTIDLFLHKIDFNFISYFTHQSIIMKRVIGSLLELCGTPQKNFHEQRDHPQVHGMNILKTLVHESCLSDAMSQFLEPIILSVLDGFNSDNWMIRNAALQLFGISCFRNT